MGLSNNDTSISFWKSFSLEVEGKVIIHKVNFLSPENDRTFMLCLSTSVSWPSFNLTMMRSLVIVSGPYSASTLLHSFNDPHLCAVRPKEDKSCSVFLSSQWSAQRFTSATSMSMKMTRSSLTPVQLKKQR